MEYSHHNQYYFSPIVFNQTPQFSKSFSQLFLIIFFYTEN